MPEPTAEEQLAAVAAIADIEPDRVKGWALLVDDGSSEAQVYTALDFPQACALVIRVAEVIIEATR